MDPTLLNAALWGLGVFSALGLFFGVGLGVAAERFKVRTNPLVERVRDSLPSANCGACGFAGCTAYAEAVVERADVLPSLCIPGREPVARAVAELTGKAAGEVLDRIVVMTCSGTSAYARNEAEYAGIPTCAAAALVFGGPRACKNGCLGLGDCVRACPFDALSIGSGGIAQVDTAKCTGCAVCVAVCPKDLFKLYPRGRRVELTCKAVDKQAIVRATCMVGCTLCRKCVSKCPAGAIEWDGRTILIDHDKCIGYGDACGYACVEICPSTIIHRVGQLPEPELVEISRTNGSLTMDTRTEPETANLSPTGGATRSLVIALAGSGGDGVALVGDLLLGMAARQGLYGMLVQSYGPQIRGGESAVVLRLSESEVSYEADETDLLLCFRLSDLKRFRGSLHLHDDSLLILEKSDTGSAPEWLGTPKRAPVRWPFATFQDGTEIAGEPKNMMGLALVCRSLGWEAALAERALTDRFGHRPNVLERNLATFRRAFAAAGDMATLVHLRGHGVPLVVETGNEAIARGAMAAGLRFFAGYPITPSSEVMETLIDEFPAVGGTLVQAEDEIAALGMVVGASFGGVPSMTATSGPGLSLMTEMMGLSSMAEIPTIIVDCQRAGPATGMPSRTEQSDLFHAIYGGHGDFPRAVLGVFDVVHARDVMFRAFEIAENYQLPVLVLSDAYVAQRRQIRDAVNDRRERPRRWRWAPEDAPARFKLSDEHPVNAFRVPGTPGGTYLAAGIEHTEQGYPTADAAIHQQMNERRFRKIPAIAMDTKDWFRTLGPGDARRGIVAWGSTYGMLREWVESNPGWRVFLPEIIHPFPLEGFEAWRKGLDEISVVELSYQGQFHRYLASLTDTEGLRSIARSGGLPMSSRELTALLAAAAAGTKERA